MNDCTGAVADEGGLRLLNRCPQESFVARQVVGGRAPVQGEHGLAGSQQRGDHVLADESGGTCDGDGTVVHGRQGRSEVQTEEFFELVDDVVELLRRQPRPDTQPESLVHYGVGVRKFAADTEVATDHIRLTRQVARE